MQKDLSCQHELIWKNVFGNEIVICLLSQSLRNGCKGVYFQKRYMIQPCTLKWIPSSVFICGFVNGLMNKYEKVCTLNC